MFVLKLPTIEDKENIKKFYYEYKINKKEIYQTLKKISLDEWIEELINKSVNSNLNKQKELMYLMYSSDNKKLLGISIIRLKLDDFLSAYWGNIGYYVNLKELRQGYGSELFKLTLKQCKQLGLKKILIVCYKDNIASNKIIQRNEGVFIEEILDENNKEILKRFYIKLI